jgi:integrase
MRTGEVNGLKWKYIDFVARLILIRETFVLGEDEYTKTDSSQRCRRRSKSEPPRRPNIEPGVEADFERVGCG